MTRTELSEDGALLVAALAAPGRGFAEVAARRRSLTAILAATLSALLLAMVAVPRLDFSREADLGQGPEAQAMTPHQVEEAQAQAAKIGAVGWYGGAGFLPVLSVLGTALSCWLAFRVAGTRPGFKATVAVTAHALLPLFLAKLLTLPAVLLQAPVVASDAARLLPSSLASLLPASAPAVAIAAASSLDLFTVWAVVLLVVGMVRVSGASPRRAAVVVALLWMAQIALFKLAPAALAAAGKAGA